MLYRDTALHAMVQELRRDIARLTALYEATAEIRPEDAEGGVAGVVSQPGGGSIDEGAIHDAAEAAVLGRDALAA